MRVLVSWLREFVDVPGSPEDLARTMSVRGFAVESIEPLAEGDAVLDFEITANRPDCMSVVGMAREVATAYGLPLKTDQKRVSLTADNADIDVVIENADLCPRYAGAVADVNVGPSPGWMQARLQAAGVRPISNIVDVTNYVLLELGQPMHAFDLARLAGPQIRVRTARPGETLRTLDGQTRELSPDILVIADAERATAIAGVMGGAGSEVTPGTRAIVLESAYFNPLSVRRASKKLGLKTEASMRFERGADPGLPVTAMARAAALLESTGAGRARGTVVDCYPTRLESRVLRLRRTRIAGVLGAAIPDVDVRRILEGLGFTLRDARDGWDVDVPTRRVDAAREVDLIEEVARHYGFDRLPVTFPPLTSAPRPVDPRIPRARRLRHVMTAAGFFESVTFGFTSERMAKPFEIDDPLVPIKNPLSEAFSVLRPSVLPGLIEAAGRNIRRERRDVRLFEIGSCFAQKSGERQTVGFVWTGSGRYPHWHEGARDVDFFDAKGVVTELCEAHDAAAHVRLLPTPPVFLVPGRAAAIIARPKYSKGAGTAGTHVGLVGQLSPVIGEEFGVPANVPAYVAEMDLDEIARFEQHVVTVTALPKYPSVVRDISLLLSDATTAESVRNTLEDLDIPTLADLVEFDRYQGKGIPENNVSLSLRLTFRSSDRTLTDADVQAAMDQVLAALKERHGAIQR